MSKDGAFKSAGHRENIRRDDPVGIMGGNEPRGSWKGDAENS